MIRPCGGRLRIRDLALVAALLAPVAAAAADVSLRFHGNGAAAPDLDRVKIRIDAPARPADVKGDFTLEFWMRALAGENTAATCAAGPDNWITGSILFDRDVFGAGDYGDWGVSLFADGLAFGVARGNAGAGICSSQNLSSEPVDLADDRWHHVAVTRRKSDGRLQIFVDGRLEATGGGPIGN
ncbi:MAG: LamG-like jellyroll fold domain-containing protein, partial [Candidatus Binatia bacterium]